MVTNYLRDKIGRQIAAYADDDNLKRNGFFCHRGKRENRDSQRKGTTNGHE